MPAGGRVDGVSVGSIAAGSLFLYAAIKGKSVLSTIQSIIQGKPPATAAAANTIAATTGGGSGGGAGPTGSAKAGGHTHNLISIGKYMHTNGYSRAAAAGIAACVAGESSGDPEAQGSGGRGLIGWTPPSKLPDSAFTGNPTADLNAQMAEIIAYNNAQGHDLIDQLNRTGDPLSAANFYSQYFERPAVLHSDVVASVALLVYGAI